MDFVSNENLGFAQNNAQETSELVSSNVKNLDLEVCEEDESPASFFEAEQDHFTFEIDEDDEDETFEDAVDEILTNNLIDCMNLSAVQGADLIRNDHSQHDSNSRENLVQKLLERQRNELALELRRLQFSNQPQDARNRLEQIFNDTASTQQPNAPNRPLAYRSENIRNEISLLNSQQRVSNIPNAFRENIERSLRQSLNLPTTRPNTDTNNIRPAIPERVSNIPNAFRENIERSLRQNSNLPTTRQNITTNNIRPAISERVSNIPNAFRENIERSLRQNSNLPTTRQNIATNNIRPDIPENVAPPARQNIATNNIRPQLPFLVSQAGEQLHDMYREQIVAEISELVHREVVSSSLQSSFRNQLESLVRMRRQEIGNNRTRENIREILANRVTSSNIERNDFSHLGITNNRVENENDDNMDSASSTSGHRRRTTVVHHSNSREIRDLKMEMQEMKNMLKMSFEMQLEMQRAFKQEISALVANTFNSSAANLFDSAKPTREGKCVICTEAECDTVLYQCGHMVSCYLCALNLKNKGHSCPVCRAPIQDIVRAFKSGLD